jgi:glycosyltransferase involved in cell wall biosynthesis
MKPTLLFVATHLNPYGGANTVIAWTLQALKDEWDITIICADYPDFEGVDRHYGTSLSGSEFRYIRLSLPVRHLEKIDPDPFSIQRAAWSMRKCQTISKAYDAVFGGEDEWDFGCPGVQYTHYPYLYRHLEALQRVDGWSRTRRFRAMLTGRIRPWLVISGIQASRVRRNWMVTNSRWTASEIRGYWGNEPRVVYPPVQWSGKNRPWNERRMSFVSIGRICPSKRLPELIDILTRVRERGFDVEYDIIGDTDVVAGEAYLKNIRRLVDKSGGWIRLNHSVSRERLQEIVCSARFGIHGMHNEHFGIGVAELIRGGCIVFVHDSGGQVEIVGDHPELRYRDDVDAVEKICAVLADTPSQTRLRDALAEHADQFTSATFMQRMRGLMRDFLESRQPA